MRHFFLRGRESIKARNQRNTSGFLCTIKMVGKFSSWFKFLLACLRRIESKKSYEKRIDNNFNPTGPSVAWF